MDRLLELLTEPKLQDRDLIWPALLVLTSMSYSPILTHAAKIDLCHAVGSGRAAVDSSNPITATYPSYHELLPSY